VSIVADSESAGHVSRVKALRNYEELLIEADYASSYGGFIDGRTRRRVEKEIMWTLAGGLAHMQALGLEAHEVGAGMVQLTESEASELATKCPELAGVDRLVVGGDLKSAIELACAVSGGDEEGAAYIEWLRQRTLNLMRDPRFWPCVEAVAGRVLEMERLSGPCVAAVIRETSAHLFENELRRRNQDRDRQS